MNARRSSDSTPDTRKLLTGYQSMVATAREAIAEIRSGQRVFIGTGCGQPQTLVNALLDRAAALEDVEIIHLITLGGAAWRHRELAQQFRLRPFFIAEGADEEIRAHLCDYTPVLLSDIPELFRSGRMPIDVALIQVTEPNEQGLCSLGISVDVTRSATENAGLVIAQVNRRMPWTTGDGVISAHDLDILVLCDEPLLEIGAVIPSEASRRIAKNVASLIPDGSLVQLGTHRIQRALLEVLKDRPVLGLYLQAVGEGIVELLEADASTKAGRTDGGGKIVCNMATGTERLYRYIDGNPAFSFRSTDYTRDPATVGGPKNVVTVGSACEVDLAGQVRVHCPEAASPGAAGEMDFMPGTTRVPAGKTIVALESIRLDGASSRIVPHFRDGAVVGALCSEVHYVVTEHGVAYLHGKSLQERAIALISIAHPDFRAGLLRGAIDESHVSTDLAGIEGSISVGPPPLRSSMVLRDGTLVSFRPMHPTDEPRMHELFHSLSQQTMYYRFMADVTRLPQRMIQNFVYIDYRDEMAIVGTLPEAHGEEIIAVGRYYLIPQTSRAEVAFIVRDPWQNRGIGTFLLKYLATIARGQGIVGFSAEVLAENKAMLAVLEHTDFRVRARMEGRVRSIEVDFE